MTPDEQKARTQQLKNEAHKRFMAGPKGEATREKARAKAREQYAAKKARRAAFINKHAQDQYL